MLALTCDYRSASTNIRIPGITCLKCKIFDVSPIKDFVIRFSLHENHNIVRKANLEATTFKLWICIQTPEQTYAPMCTNKLLYAYEKRSWRHSQHAKHMHNGKTCKKSQFIQFCRLENCMRWVNNYSYEIGMLKLRAHRHIYGFAEACCFICKIHHFYTQQRRALLSKTWIPFGEFHSWAHQNGQVFKR